MVVVSASGFGGVTPSWLSVGSLWRSGPGVRLGGIVATAARCEHERADSDGGKESAGGGAHSGLLGEGAGVAFVHERGWG